MMHQSHLAERGRTIERLDEHGAREILDATHAAWSFGDVDGVLAHYVPDMAYWCNAGQGGLPLTIAGIVPFAAFLRSIREVAESVSVSNHFRFSDGIGRAQIECYIKEKKTGHTLVGSYRQVLTFRGDKILRLEEFHDAAKMAAFWRLIAGEAMARPAPQETAG